MNATMNMNSMNNFAFAAAAAAASAATAGISGYSAASNPFAPGPSHLAHSVHPYAVQPGQGLLSGAPSMSQKKLFGAPTSISAAASALEALANTATSNIATVGSGKKRKIASNATNNSVAVDNAGASSGVAGGDLTSMLERAGAMASMGSLETFVTVVVGRYFKLPIPGKEGQLGIPAFTTYMTPIRLVRAAINRSLSFPHFVLFCLGVLRLASTKESQRPQHRVIQRPNSTGSSVPFNLCLC